MGGKQRVLQFAGDMADEAGAGIRALLADDSMFAAFQRPEVLKHLTPEMQLRVMRNDPSVIPDLLSLQRTRANVDDVAARATPLVEAPYENLGVGRREAPLNRGPDWVSSPGRDLLPMGGPGPGVPVGPPVDTPRGLIPYPTVRPTPGAGRVEDVFDVTPEGSFGRELATLGRTGRAEPVGLFGGPDRELAVVPQPEPPRTPGAGRRESPMNPNADWTSSDTTDLVPFEGVRGEGVPQMDRGLTVQPQAPKESWWDDPDLRRILGATLGAGYIQAVQRGAASRPIGEGASRQPSQPTQLQVLIDAGVHPQRAEHLVENPQYINSAIRRLIPPDKRFLFQ
jgi:hypothetical protein